MMKGQTEASERLKAFVQSTWVFCNSKLYCLICPRLTNFCSYIVILVLSARSSHLFLTVSVEWIWRCISKKLLCRTDGKVRQWDYVQFVAGQRTSCALTLQKCCKLGNFLALSAFRWNRRLFSSNSKNNYCESGKTNTRTLLTLPFPGTSIVCLWSREKNHRLCSLDMPQWSADWLCTSWDLTLDHKLQIKNKLKCFKKIVAIFLSWFTYCFRRSYCFFSLLFFFYLKVAQVYRDRSIGNSINIVVVKIVFLETNEVWYQFFSETFKI